MSRPICKLVLSAVLLLTAGAASAQYARQTPSAGLQADAWLGSNDTVFILYDGETQFDDIPLSTDRQARLPRAPREPMRVDYRGWSLRTNGLYWLALTPNAGIGIEGSRIEGSLNFAWAGWELEGGEKRYRLAMVSPELRYLFGLQKRWFAGVNLAFGQFNMKINDVGYQGTALAAGVVGGYRIPITQRLRLDLSVGAGASDLKYDSYTSLSGADIRKQGDLTKLFLGPTHLTATLVWKINRP